MKYPDKFIRGISNKSFIDEEGLLTAQAFQFMSSDDHPGFDEASINWYDNDEAVRIAWEQKKSPEDELPQFKAGVAILSRLSLDYVFSQPFMTDILEYERKPTRGNPYHGNLLRVQDLPAKRKNFIASTIAMVCLEKIITRE